MIPFLLLMLMFISPSIQAKQLQVDFAVGAQASHENSLDRVDWGISLKSHMTYYNEGFMQYGIFLNNDSPSAILLSDSVLGFGVRFGENFYMELGAGLRYSAIYGSGMAVIVGSGYRLSDSISLFFPVMLKDYGNLTFVPHLGFRL